MTSSPEVHLSLSKKLAFSAALTFIVLFLIALMLYGAEAYLAYEEYDIERGTGLRIERAAEAAGIKFDHRSTVEVIRDLRAQGRDAYPPVSPGVFPDSDGIEVNNVKFFPLGGVSKAATAFCNEAGEWIVYDSDEHGFNNPTGLWQPGNVDVAIVGSSFIQGSCVKPEQTIAGQLRAKGIRTLSLGLGGSGPLAANAVVREYLQAARPKYVIFSLYAVDVRAPVYEQASPTLVKYLDDPAFSQHFLERQPEVDQLLRKYLGDAYETRLAELTSKREERRRIIKHRLISEGLYLHKLRERIRNFGGRDRVTEGRETEKLALLERALLSSKAKVEQWGGKLIFMYLPDWYTYAETYDTYGIKIDGNFLLRQDVLAMVRKHGIPVIDIQGEVFDKQKDPVSLWNFRMYGHYTLTGYTLVSDRIAEFLRSDMSLTVNGTHGTQNVR